MSIQLMGQYLNEYYDKEVDRLTGNNRTWFYSSQPFSLMSSGWGELTTSVIVVLMVPLMGYCMQGGFPPAILWLACVPLVLIHAAMLIPF